MNLSNSIDQLIAIIGYPYLNYISIDYSSYSRQLEIQYNQYNGTYDINLYAYHWDDSVRDSPVVLESLMGIQDYNVISRIRQIVIYDHIQIEFTDDLDPIFM